MRTVGIEFEVAELLEQKKLHVTTAESCTGGLIAGALVNVPGISEWFGEGYVTYSNEAKHKNLGVKKSTLKKYGAVSKQTAKQMCKGCCKAAKADVGLSATGIAGPGGGTAEKPVGLMYSTIYTKNKTESFKVLLSPDLERIKMKEAFAQAVLEKVYSFLLFV